MGLFCILSILVLLIYSGLMLNKRSKNQSDEDLKLIAELSFVFVVLSMSALINDYVVDVFVLSAVLLIFICFINLMICVFIKSDLLSKWFKRLIVLDLIGFLVGIPSYDRISTKEHIGISLVLIAIQMIIIMYAVVLLKNIKTPQMVKQTGFLFAVAMIMLPLVMGLDMFGMVMLVIISLLITVGILAFPFWKVSKILVNQENS